MDAEIQIIRDSLRLFRLYGIRSLSLEDIARFIRIPFKTLRKYFQTKEILLQKCVKYWISQAEIFKYTDDHLLDVLINFSDAFPRLYQKVNCRSCLEIRKYYPRVSCFLYGYFERYALVCRDKVGEGIALGYIQRSITPRLVYDFFMENFEKLFAARMGRDSLEDEECMRQAILVFARGIVTKNGRVYMDRELKKRMV